MSPADLIARLDEQRAFWVPLSEGRRVKLQRPLETEMGAFVEGVGVDAVCQRAVAWEGFSEATFLGAAIGASDPLPFNADLWARWARDHAADTRACLDELVKAIGDYLAEKGDTAKN